MKQSLFRKKLKARVLYYLLPLTSCLFFSCLSDSDENSNQGLSKAEINQCVTNTRGEYSGYLVYPARNPTVSTDQADTLTINWTITSDTTLVVSHFPGKTIAENITRNNELKAAMIEQNPTQQLLCDMAFYAADPTIMFVLGPHKMEFPVYYKDATHTVKAYFWSNTVSEILSNGAVDPSNKEMVARIVLGAVYLDDDENTNLLGTSSTIMIPIYLTTSF
jgi:hypothetical protein